MSNVGKPVRFNNTPHQREFLNVLRKRIDNYFNSNKISKHWNVEMMVKTVISIAGWVGSWVLMMTAETGTAGFILLYMLHGFFMLFMAFNVSHDANHKGFSSNQTINKILSYSFDVVGVNSYMWRQMHNDSHHHFVNVSPTDVAIKSSGLLRFSPNDPASKIHRYHHIYASFIYLLVTMEWVLIKDFNWFFFKKDIGNKFSIKHPWQEIAKLFAFKAFYYTYTLVLPILLLPHAWYIVVLAFFLMHCMIGFTIAAIFQTTHVVEGTSYPLPDEQGSLENNWAVHIIETTADYSWKNPVANWFWGCLNVHSIHHMFPHICHVHYPALTPILKQTAEEFNIQYRDFPSIYTAYIAHLKMLKRLGTAQEEAAEKSSQESAINEQPIHA